MNPEPDASGTWPGWTRELPVVRTQPDGRVRIQDYGIDFKDDHTRPRFYPRTLLQHILTRQVLSCEIEYLEKLGATEKEILVGRVLGSGNPISDTYIRVFAILKVIGQLERLPAFVREGVSDQQLPLYCDKERGDHLFYGKLRKPLPDDLLKSNELQGGFGMVTKISIHPLCHNFRSAFRALDVSEINLQLHIRKTELTGFLQMFFALKQFHENDPASFEREIKMLQRFNRTRHPHIVTLLAAYTHCGKNYLIFPWATHDLQMYWEKVRPTPDAGDVKLVRWICHQAWKLVQAISRIHELDEDAKIPEEERLYGRHGDLKPENILWYKSRQGFGKLVIADMGLSKTHRYHTKTYAPKQKVPATARYRPPELDYEDGLLGRAFDIWTLGCIFLEMMNWLHGGYAQLAEMEDKMTTRSIQGYDCNEYFEWVYVTDRRFSTVRVKEVVTECIKTLRRESSQFVHDFLDIIEYRMLVVDRNERAPAGGLVHEMEKLHRKCDADDYCVQKEKREPCDALKPVLQERVFKDHKDHKDQSTRRERPFLEVTSSDFRRGSAVSKIPRKPGKFCYFL
ncbi:kinase-like domain-containing protein [Xylaria flabelliformis]|nr:kinase-like domain-containing protein [Xylaria flabelliformis]